MGYEEEPPAQYRVRYAPESRRIAGMSEARIYPPRYSSPLPYLWAMDDLEWHAVMPLSPYAARRHFGESAEQARLFP